MGMGRLVTVLVITNVGANGDADRYLVSVSVGWWETCGYIDGYEKVIWYIDGHENLLIISDRGIDRDAVRFYSTLS